MMEAWARLTNSLRLGSTYEGLKLHLAEGNPLAHLLWALPMRD